MLNKDDFEILEMTDLQLEPVRLTDPAAKAVGFVYGNAFGMFVTSPKIIGNDVTAVCICVDENYPAGDGPNKFMRFTGGNLDTALDDFLAYMDRHPSSAMALMMIGLIGPVEKGRTVDWSSVE